VTTRKRRKREAASVNKTPKRGEDPGYKPVRLVARTPNQKEYIRSIYDNEVVFATGPAGTGKTHVAIGKAVEMVRHEFCDRIILTRPLVGVGKDMGFLPGDMLEKVGPYITPCFDELSYYLSQSMIKQWMCMNKIEVVPLSMMRGRTFNSAFVILDEAQNATKTELKTLLTRIGDPCRMVIVGDTCQTDLPSSESGALDEAVDRLNHVEGIHHVQLTDKDIVRNPIIGDIIKYLW